MRGLSDWTFAPLFRHDSQRRIQRRDAVHAKLVAAGAPISPRRRAGCELSDGNCVENPARVNVSFEIWICVLGGITASIVCLTTLLSIVQFLCSFISVVLIEVRNEMIIIIMTGKRGWLADCTGCNL